MADCSLAVFATYFPCGQLVCFTLVQDSVFNFVKEARIILWKLLLSGEVREYNSRFTESLVCLKINVL